MSAGIPSATLLLLRDGAAGLEVLLLARRREARAFAGALVFPGGKLAPGDHDPELLALCRGAAGLDGLERVHRIAAVREAFEECGLLLARAEGGDTLVDDDRVAALTGYRRPLDRGELGIAELCRHERLEPALDRLVAFAHWVTPRGRAQIFDTRFYLTAAPPGQTARHDGAEVLDSQWIGPTDAIARAERGELKLVFPTRMSLQRLARSASVAEALDRARREPVVRIQPEIEQHPEGQLVSIPPQAGYGVSRVLVLEDGRRFVMMD